MWKKYRKKPIIIKAIQWNGDNLEEIKKFCEFHSYLSHKSSNILIIKTLEGNMECKKGGYVIIGVNGELYPIKEDIFHQTYERVYEE